MRGMLPSNLLFVKIGKKDKGTNKQKNKGTKIILAFNKPSTFQDLSTQVA